MEPKADVGGGTTDYFVGLPKGVSKSKATLPITVLGSLRNSLGG
jgi:hypothetical protein